MPLLLKAAIRLRIVGNALDVFPPNSAAKNEIEKRSVNEP